MGTPRNSSYAPSDIPRFFRITPGGVVTFLGDMDHVSKGLAPARSLDPVPALPGSTSALLLLGLVTTGGLAILTRARVVP